jgi:hypothetical protein
MPATLSSESGVVTSLDVLLGALGWLPGAASPSASPAPQAANPAPSNANDTSTVIFRDNRSIDMRIPSAR